MSTSERKVNYKLIYESEKLKGEQHEQRYKQNVDGISAYTADE